MVGRWVGIEDGAIVVAFPSGSGVLFGARTQINHGVVLRRRIRVSQGVGLGSRTVQLLLPSFRKRCCLEEEEEFITSGNWRGKHNSLSRGAGADQP